MNKIKSLKKIFLTICLGVVIFTSSGFVDDVSAQNIFGVQDPAGCESKDPIFPSLVICGRSPATGACTEYTKPCNLGDLISTLGRGIIWVITFVFLIIPLIIIYYGAMIIINKQMDGNISMLKKGRQGLGRVVLYFILILAGWLIIRTVVDVFQVQDRVPTFLIDENNAPVKARNFEN